MSKPYDEPGYTDVVDDGQARDAIIHTMLGLGTPTQRLDIIKRALEKFPRFHETTIMSTLSRLTSLGLVDKHWQRPDPPLYSLNENWTEKLRNIRNGRK